MGLFDVALDLVSLPVRDAVVAKAEGYDKRAQEFRYENRELDAQHYTGIATGLRMSLNLIADTVKKPARYCPVCERKEVNCTCNSC